MKIELPYQRQKYIEIKPGPTNQFDIEKLVALGYDTIQLKYDGIWVLVHVTESNEILYYSRSGELKHSRFDNAHQPGYYCGEYIFGSEWADKGTVKKGSIHLFDCVSKFGSPLTNESYRKRYKCLPDWARVRNYPISCINEIWRAEVLTNRYEGIIIRNSKEDYFGTVLKAKPIIEVDAVAIEVYEGTGKYTDNLGGIVFQYSKGTFKCGGGFTDQQRSDIWSNQQMYLGRTATISGKKLFKSGALRHPNFERWHLEK